VKKKIAKAPIMSLDDERFMAFEGLAQWTAAAISAFENVILPWTSMACRSISPSR
jgi:hypothetical protein